MNKPRNRAYVYILASVAIWGAASSVIKYTLDGIDPLPFLAYRFIISGIISGAIFLFKFSEGKKFRQFRANIGMVTLYGIISVPIALGSLFVGIDRSTVLDMTVISFLGPLMIALGAYFMFRERITKRERKGIKIVLAGAFIGTVLPVFFQDNQIRLTGNLFLILFLLTDTLSVLIAKKLVKDRVKSENLTNFAFILGTLTIIPIVLWKIGMSDFWQIVSGLDLKYHLGVWYMAIISGNLAYFLYTRAQKTIEASEAVLFRYLQPIFAVPLAVFWLGETISISFIVGISIVIAGVCIAEYKPKKNKTA